MNGWTLIKRSLGYHWRLHAGVLLGAAIGSAALIGALVVGDSVRQTLREQALQRLGQVHFAWLGGDRLFRQQLAQDIGQRMTRNRWRLGWTLEPVLEVAGAAARQDNTARANHVAVLGVTSNFFQLGGQARALKPGEVLLNESLANQLNARAGDQIIVRVRKPAALSMDAPIAPQSEMAVALRLRIAGVLPASALGNFSLRANQVPPHNAFVAIDSLAGELDVSGRANVIVGGPVMDGGPRPVPWWGRLFPAFFDRARGASQMHHEVDAADIPSYADPFPLALDDMQLSLSVSNDFVELRTTRIFIDEFIGHAATNKPGSVLAAGKPILTYLANLITAGTNSTPYSMVTAAGPPYTPADLKSDEVVVNQWLAEDLNLREGDSVALTYFAPDSSAQLIERTNRFRVRQIVPLGGWHADRTLMPDFPGIAKAESTHDWDAGFPLVHKIRPKDDAYWKQHRGTPKAFISPAAGQALWANRFGNATSIRWPVPTGLAPAAVAGQVESNLVSRITPGEAGIQFQAVREQALNAAAQAQDFGGLFIGFSIFLIVASLILMALLFQFGIEQRAPEIGTLLGLGFRARQVRRFLLFEAAVLALAGGILGTLGGLFYARLMLRGLTTIWRDATNTAALSFQASPQTLMAGLLAAVLVALFAIWLVLRKQARQPARELLSGTTPPESTAPSPQGRGQGVRGKEPFAHSRALRIRMPGAKTIAWLTLILALIAIAAAFVTRQTTNPEYFFTAGSLCLISGIAFTSTLLRRIVTRPSLGHLTAGSLSMRGAARRRNRSVATVALLACGVFMLVAVGAFRLDANKDTWKRGSGTGGFALMAESTLPILKDLNNPEGREALGIDEKLMREIAFVPFRVREGDDASCLNLNRAQAPRLLGVAPDLLDGRFSFTSKAGWTLLGLGNPTGPVPAIGDAASIQWALGRKLGDSISYRDDFGRACDVRLAGAVQNSVLQGSLIIAEKNFTRHFPNVTGYRMFLIDCPSNAVPAVAAELTRALQDYGFEVTPAAGRLAALNAVQNTYLNTFQILGGLGLLLGSAGLGIVVLRNVLERRGELALLLAVGFRGGRVQQLVVVEHAALLGLGLLVGVGSSLVAVFPGLLARSELPAPSLALTVCGVFLFGLISTWLATRAAVSGELLKALRNE